MLETMIEVEVHPLITNRRSPRAFDPNRSLSKNTVSSLLEAV